MASPRRAVCSPAPLVEHVAKHGGGLIGQAERQIGLAEPKLGLDAVGIGLQGPPVEGNGRIEIARLARSSACLTDAV